jgi:hypothetical protein
LEVIVKKGLMLSVISILFLTSFLGCGAVFHGTRQTIQANSAPNGAKIEIMPTGSRYTTPASINLERKLNYVLSFSKEGYKPATFEIQKSLSGGILVMDVLFTGLLGVIVDAATGAWYNLSPEVATVSLEKDGISEGPDKIEIHISLKEDKLRIDSGDERVDVNVEESE